MATIAPTFAGYKRWLDLGRPEHKEPSIWGFAKRSIFERYEYWLKDRLTEGVEPSVSDFQNFQRWENDQDRWERRQYDINRVSYYSSESSGPPDFDPSKITLPVVPLEEEDPRVRINVMINMFNASLLLPDSRVDRGFLHEINTATDLVHAGRIVSGKQISRPLIATETKSGLKGDSQNILAPLGDGTTREIDMLCQIQGKTYIVEAKYTQNTDTHQLKRNMDLAQQLGGGVMYYLGGEKMGQEKALKERFEELLGARKLPPLQVMHTHQIVSDIKHTVGKTQVSGEIPLLVTTEENLRRMDLEFSYGEKVSHEDLDFCEREVRMLEDSVEKSDKTAGWAKRALEHAAGDTRRHKTTKTDL